jgi:hypothetical protein
MSKLTIIVSVGFSGGTTLDVALICLCPCIVVDEITIPQGMCFELSLKVKATGTMSSFGRSFRASKYHNIVIVRRGVRVVDKTAKAAFSRFMHAIQPAPKLALLPTSTILPAHQFHQTTVTAPKRHWPHVSPRQSRCRCNASAKHPACFSNRDSGDPFIVKRGFQFRASNSSDLEDIESLASLLFSLLWNCSEKEDNILKSLENGYSNMAAATASTHLFRCLNCTPMRLDC